MYNIGICPDRSPILSISPSSLLPTPLPPVLFSLNILQLSHSVHDVLFNPRYRNQQTKSLVNGRPEEV
jgi:hypothetical protein